MFTIYWTIVVDGQRLANSKEFGRNEMTQALHFAEALRTKQRNGLAICHVTMSSENPDSVGLAGVAETDSSYAWKKRRL
ncbi:hypothetical protein H8L32_07080 [Undibacterium sp. CY18W]|uniref:Uncharacterized protein n=1 Tax=Undibacterium hunanense TaxID=2762292 RepID=A0ABR6ZMZ0_9BURK|nr:hypothetical protein [Undibacterium hunanense]MBC3917232.1 hypothetical protein [Undibacterium hunanense]